MMMMRNNSECLVVPKWRNLKQQRQQQVEEEKLLSLSDSSEAISLSINRKSSHVHSDDCHNHPHHPPATHLVPMSNYDEIAELTWENGQLNMHGLGGLVPTHYEKPKWARAHDTLESIVEQAQGTSSCQQYQKPKFTKEDQYAPITTSASTSSIGASSHHQMVPTLTKKRSRSYSDNHHHGHGNTNYMLLEEQHCDIPISGCASVSATFFRDNDNDTTMMTWLNSLDEYGRSFKNKIREEDSACHSGSEIQENQDDRDRKAEIGQSNSTTTTIRRNRTAAVHNQSERRRRDRINQKIKALQRLVPNASKSDKASMLEEVINYLKKLQAHIQMMSMTHSMPHMMMMPNLAMQHHQQQLHHHHMSMLARMGMGMGMGMVNINNMGMAPPIRSFPQQLIQPTTINVAPNSFMMPSSNSLLQFQPQYPYALPKHHEPAAAAAASSSTNASIPMPARYSTTTFAQAVNMEDLLNNMAALYTHQMSQKNQALRSLSKRNHERN